jgi:cysteinyl-tRNA synthetase
VPLQLYDSLERRKREFVPIDAGDVRMYVCGPTVYDFAHIGNARPVIVFDVLFRLLRRTYGEAHVTYARNITDIDDKINNRAREEGVSIGDLTARTTAEFHDDVRALGNLPPSVEPRATGTIGPMIEMIQRLIANGHAYAAEGHVLFHVPAMKDYGKLSGRSRDEMIAGARIDVVPYKRDPGDFVLWKPSDAQTPGWDSPWGRGRPGWHIECSAMSKAHLREHFDIHGGGRDLIFPHHENEVAQSECANGTPFANYWVHNGFVTVAGEKMSKSLGNFLTVRDLRAKYPGEAIRLAMLKTHYRQPLDWTDAAVKEAKGNLDRWYRLLEIADDSARGSDFEPDYRRGDHPETPNWLGALYEDLNTAEHFWRISELCDQAYRYVHESKTVELLWAANELRTYAGALGLLQQQSQDWFRWQPQGAVVDETKIDDLIAARAAAKKAKNFAEADRIRGVLADQGIVLEDKPGGVTEWRRAS